MSDYDTEKSIFESGVGRDEDLKPLIDYDNKNEEEFEANVKLLAAKDVEKPDYRPLKINYSIIPKATKVIPDHQDVQYGVNLKGYPNYLANYYLQMTDPITKLPINFLNLKQDNLWNNRKKEFFKNMNLTFPKNSNQLLIDETYKDFENLKNEASKEENLTYYIEEQSEYEGKIKPEGKYKWNNTKEEFELIENQFIDDNVHPYRNYQRLFKNYEDKYNEGNDLEENYSEGYNRQHPKKSFDLEEEDFLELPEKVKLKYRVYPRIFFKFDIINPLNTKNIYNIEGKSDEPYVDGFENDLTSSDVNMLGSHDRSSGYSNICKLDIPKNNKGEFYDFENDEESYFWNENDLEETVGIRKILNNVHDKMKTHLWHPIVKLGDYKTKIKKKNWSWGNEASNFNEGDNKSFITTEHNDKMLLKVDAEGLCNENEKFVDSFTNENTNVYIPWPKTTSVDGSDVKYKELETSDERSKKFEIRTSHKEGQINSFQNADLEATLHGEDYAGGLASGSLVGFAGMAVGFPLIGWVAGAIAAILVVLGYGEEPVPIVGLSIVLEIKRDELRIEKITNKFGTDEIKEISDYKSMSSTEKSKYDNNIDNLKAINNETFDEAKNNTLDNKLFLENYPGEVNSQNNSNVNLMFAKDMSEKYLPENYNKYDLYAKTSYYTEDDMPIDNEKKEITMNKNKLENWSNDDPSPYVEIPQIDGNFGDFTTNNIQYPNINENHLGDTKAYEDSLFFKLPDENSEEFILENDVYNSKYPFTFFMADSTILTNEMSSKRFVDTSDDGYGLDAIDDSLSSSDDTNGSSYYDNKVTDEDNQNIFGLFEETIENDQGHKEIIDAVGDYKATGYDLAKIMHHYVAYPNEEFIIEDGDNYENNMVWRSAFDVIYEYEGNIENYLPPQTKYKCNTMRVVPTTNKSADVDLEAAGGIERYGPTDSSPQQKIIRTQKHTINSIKEIKEDLKYDYNMGITTEPNRIKIYNNSPINIDTVLNDIYGRPVILNWSKTDDLDFQDTIEIDNDKGQYGFNINNLQLKSLKITDDSNNEYDYEILNNNTNVIKVLKATTGDVLNVEGLLRKEDKNNNNTIEIDKTTKKFDNKVEIYCSDYASLDEDIKNITGTIKHPKIRYRTLPPVLSKQSRLSQCLVNTDEHPKILFSLELPEKLNEIDNKNNNIYVTNNKRIYKDNEKTLYENLEYRFTNSLGEGSENGHPAWITVKHPINNGFSSEDDYSLSPVFIKTKDRKYKLSEIKYTNEAQFDCIVNKNTEPGKQSDFEAKVNFEQIKIDDVDINNKNNIKQILSIKDINNPNNDETSEIFYSSLVDPNTFHYEVKINEVEPYGWDFDDQKIDITALEESVDAEFKYYSKNKKVISESEYEAKIRGLVEKSIDNHNNFQDDILDLYNNIDKDIYKIETIGIYIAYNIENDFIKDIEDYFNNNTLDNQTEILNIINEDEHYTNIFDEIKNNNKISEDDFYQLEDKYEVLQSKLDKIYNILIDMNLFDNEDFSYYTIEDGYAIVDYIRDIDVVIKKNKAKSKKGQDDNVLNNKINISADYSKIKLTTETVLSENEISYPENKEGFSSYPTKKINANKEICLAYSDLPWKGVLPEIDDFNFEDEDRIYKTPNSVNYIVDSNNKNINFKINREEQEIIGVKEDSNIWNPKIHTGYMYLNDNNTAYNELIQEHYLYNNHEIRLVSAAQMDDREELNLDNYNPYVEKTNIDINQFAPIIIKAKGNDEAEFKTTQYNKQIDIGYGHVCAIKEDGSLVSWGSNEAPWGDTTNQVNNTPSSNGFVDVSCGTAHSIALKEDGTIKAWGVDSLGQVSDVPEGNSFVRVYSNGHYNIALKEDGSLVDWGNNEDFELPNEDNIVSLSIGNRNHVVAIREDSSLTGWGSDDYDLISDIPKGNGFVQIDCGENHNVALKKDGSIVSWGYDFMNQVSGTPGGNDFVWVNAGGKHSTAVKKDGSLISWGAEGYDHSNQVENTPTEQEFLQSYCDDDFNIALKEDGSLEAWGSDNDNLVSDTPTKGVFRFPEKKLINKSEKEENVFDKKLKRVTFFDDQQNPTLLKTETLKVTNQNKVLLTYKDPIVETISIKSNNENVSFEYNKDNVVEIKEDNLNEVEVSYLVKDTFLIKREYNQEKGIMQNVFVFSNKYDQYQINYEANSYSPFHEIENIDINPGVNDLKESFLYITNDDKSTYDINFNQYQKDICTSHEEFILKINLIDKDNNPIYHKFKNKDISINSKNDNLKTEILNESDINVLGENATNSTPDFNGNVYIKCYIKDKDINEETITIEVDNIKASLDINFYKPNTKERFVFLDIDKTILSENQPKTLKFKVFDEYFSPVNKGEEIEVNIDSNTYQIVTGNKDRKSNIAELNYIPKLSDDKDNKIVIINAKTKNFDGYSHELNQKINIISTTNKDSVYNQKYIEPPVLHKDKTTDLIGQHNRPVENGIYENDNYKPKTTKSFVERIEDLFNSKDSMF